MSPPTPPRTMADFKEQNGRFPKGNRVHAVALQDWVEGLQVPGPACGTPSGSFNPKNFLPIKADVSCDKCNPLLRTTQPTTPIADTDPDQLDLLTLCPNGCDGPCICDHPDDCACGCGDDDTASDDEPRRDDKDCTVPYNGYCAYAYCEDCPLRDDGERCPVDCACAWCKPTTPRVLITTMRPDPAYL